MWIWVGGLIVLLGGRHRDLAAAGRDARPRARALPLARRAGDRPRLTRSGTRVTALLAALLIAVLLTS